MNTIFDDCKQCDTADEKVNYLAGFIIKRISTPRDDFYSKPHYDSAEVLKYLDNQYNRNYLGIVYTPVYFPIQKFAKILPSTSSLVISPVISARCSIDFLISTDKRSPEILLFSPILTSLIAFKAFISAS